MAIWEFTVFMVGLVVVGAILVGTLRSGISPMPSSGKAQRAMLSLIPQSVTGPVYELGSGWGQLALAAAKQLKNVRVIGYESSLFPWMFSLVLRAFKGKSQIEFRWADFRKRDFSDAQLVLCYLYPGAMSHLAERLQKELKPGSVIISNTFRLPGWEPEKVVELDDMHKTQIYRYIIQ